MRREGDGGGGCLVSLPFWPEVFGKGGAAFEFSVQVTVRAEDACFGSVAHLEAWWTSTSVEPWTEWNSCA